MKKSAWLIIILFCSCAGPVILNSKGRKVNNKAFLAFYQQEVNNLGLKANDTLLDIGAGSGEINAVYSLLVPNLHQVLVDIDSTITNSSAVKKAYKNIRKPFKADNQYSYTIVRNTTTQIPLPANSYSKILCRKSLHEFTAVTAMLNETARLLRNDGILVIIETKPKKPGEIDPGCKRLHLSAETIIAILKANGFRLIKEQTETMTFDYSGQLSVLSFVKDLNF